MGKYGDIFCSLFSLPGENRRLCLVVRRHHIQSYEISSLSLNKIQAASVRVKDGASIFVENDEASDKAQIFHWKYWTVHLCVLNYKWEIAMFSVSMYNLYLTLILYHVARRAHIR